jgi:hypothetical protein
MAKQNQRNANKSNRQNARSRHSLNSGPAAFRLGTSSRTRKKVIDKEELLKKIFELVQAAEYTGDEDAQQSAHEIGKVVIICAAGMDEVFAELVDDLFHRAVYECVADEFGEDEANRILELS